MSAIPGEEPLRPRDLALLLLASGDLRPRQRARDQQADTAGLDLKRRVLDCLAALDPEPAELEAALVRIIEEMGPPLGPTRAIATLVRDEWQTACLAPEWILHLLHEGTATQTEKPRRRRT
ncbi:MAG TPA: hypothetical protein VEL76_38430 [Gemmataceae bacterium]|nr:hypothetical protein [Gemmataceae bacterium]